MKKGGYIIIDLQSASIVNDLAKALDSNKPVLVYDANNDANFYTLAYDSDNSVYTLTGATGGYTINASGVVTPTANGGKIYQHSLQLDKSDNVLIFVIYSTKSTALTFNEILNYVKGNLIGFGYDNTATKEITSYITKTDSVISLVYSGGESSIDFDSTSTITDTIVEI